MQPSSAAVLRTRHRPLPHPTLRRRSEAVLGQCCRCIRRKGVDWSMATTARGLITQAVGVKGSTADAGMPPKGVHASRPRWSRLTIPQKCSWVWGGLLSVACSTPEGLASVSSEQRCPLNRTRPTPQSPLPRLPHSIPSYRRWSSSTDGASSVSLRPATPATSWTTRYPPPPSRAPSAGPSDAHPSPFAPAPPGDKPLCRSTGARADSPAMPIAPHCRHRGPCAHPRRPCPP